MAVAWANVSLGEAAVSNQADKIANDLFVNIKDLDRKEQEHHIVTGYTKVYTQVKKTVAK